MDPGRSIEWLAWVPRQEDYFEKMFGLLKAYKETRDGDCYVPEGLAVEGVNLGYWVTRQRKRRKEGKMDPERERRLGDLGLWDWFDDDWEERFQLLKDYKEVHGHCKLPWQYEVNDVNLGRWVEVQRRRYKQSKMDPEQERRLSELGVSLRPLQQDWEERFRLLEEYKEAHGHCNVPYKYEVKGIKLGYWVKSQRQRYKEGKMDPEQERLLTELSFKWGCWEEDWEERFQLLADYKEAHGHCNVPYKYEVEGIKLGAWVKNQRRRYKEGKMDPEQERWLRELGFSLQPRKERGALRRSAQF